MSDRWFDLIKPPLSRPRDTADPWLLIPKLRADLNAALEENRHLRAVLAEAIRQNGGTLIITDARALAMPTDATIYSQHDASVKDTRIWAVQNRKEAPSD